MLDASAGFEVVTLSSLAPRIREATRGESMAVPALFDAEVLSVIRRFFLHREMSLAEGNRALSLLAQLPAERMALPLLLGDAFALRDRLSGFDALYVALAARRRARVVTLDARLARAAGDLVEVVLITA